MSEESIQRAGQVLRIYLSVDAGTAARAKELSTLVEHISSDQMRPVWSDDPQEAIDEVATGRARENLLDEAVTRLRQREVKLEEERHASP